MFYIHLVREREHSGRKEPALIASYPVVVVHEPICQTCCLAYGNTYTALSNIRYGKFSDLKLEIQNVVYVLNPWRAESTFLI